MEKTIKESLNQVKEMLSPPSLDDRGRIILWEENGDYTYINVSDDMLKIAVDAIIAEVRRREVFDELCHIK